MCCAIVKPTGSWTSLFIDKSLRFLFWNRYQYVQRVFGMCVCVGIKQIKSNEQWLFYWLGTFTIPNTLALWYANAFILSLKPGEIIIRINFVVIVKSFCILQLTGMCIQIKNGWLYVAGRPQRPPRKKMKPTQTPNRIAWDKQSEFHGSSHRNEWFVWVWHESEIKSNHITLCEGNKKKDLSAIARRVRTYISTDFVPSRHDSFDLAFFVDNKRRAEKNRLGLTRAFSVDVYSSHNYSFFQIRWCYEQFTTNLCVASIPFGVCMCIYAFRKRNEWIESVGRLFAKP